MAYISEYKAKCDKCKDRGNNMFARIFYRMILGEWMYLCKVCWESEGGQIKASE